jgi:hypothetical protein
VYIFAFDDKSLRILKTLALENVTIISLAEFEDAELIAIKHTRTRGEYCWTCTPSTILFVINTYHVDHCIYLDSDLYFFASPQPVMDEMGSNSVLITPHRYTLRYDQSQKTGIYCVQFVIFKKDERGLAVLNWWRKACLEWCYNRFEAGKFGDQKYLDDWPERFAGVQVCENLGAGVAPWNMQQYFFSNEKDGIAGTEITSGNTFPVIFFHFHSFAFVAPSCFSPRPYYKRNRSALILLFNPYRNEILNIRNQIPQVKQSEVYLSGLNKIKYLIELFLRRGFQEIFNIKLLHS